MRTVLASLLLLALAACGDKDAATTSAQTGSATAASTPDGTVSMSSTRHMPDWLFILRQRDGGTIHFNQRTITRQNGMADIWLQVRYGHQQLYQSTAGRRETIIRYELERVHYRFNCAEEKFLIVERQFMGANEQVVARDEPRQIWRAVQQGGAAGHVMPIACRGN